MRFLRQSLLGLFLLSLTAGLLLWAGQMVYEAVSERMAREGRTAQARERVFAVNVVTATPQEVVPELRAFGEIRSRRTLELRAASGGTVLDLSEDFVEGGQVQAGQTLLQLDPADAQDARARALSDLSDAEAEVRDAARALALAEDELTAARAQAGLRSKALARQQDLEARGVGTAAAVETAELNLASAEQAVLARRQAIAQSEARRDQAATRLARSQLALAEADRRLVDRQIAAEFDGTLAEVAAVAGGLVSANEKLAVLVDPSALEVSFRVSTPQYLRLLDEAGELRPTRVTVSLDVMGIDLQAEGQLSRDGAAVGDGQTGRLLFATLDAPRGLKPGDFVTVSVAEPSLPDVITLPASALDAASTVLVIGAEERLESQPVTLLRRQGDMVLVRAPALTGREIVTRRSPVLGAGIKVRPLRQSGDAAPEAPEMVELSEERRARIRAFVENNNRMPADVKQRLLAQLAQKEVPARVVNRIESRMGG